MTRFGEISPLWQNFESPWQSFKDVPLFWIYFVENFATVEICIICIGTYGKSYLAIWSHWLSDLPKQFVPLFKAFLFCINDDPNYHHPYRYCQHNDIETRKNIFSKCCISCSWHQAVVCSNPRKANFKKSCIPFQQSLKLHSDCGQCDQMAC